MSCEGGGVWCDHQLDADTVDPQKKMDKSAESRTPNASPNLLQTQHVDIPPSNPTLALVITHSNAIHNPSPRPNSARGKSFRAWKGTDEEMGRRGCGCFVFVCKVSGVKGGRFEVFEV